MTATTECRYTADEFAQLRDWKEWELVDGSLIPFHCSARASEISGQLLSALVTWARAGRRDRVFSSGTSYSCFPAHPDTVRRPWVSVVRAERLAREQVPDIGHFELAPDVAGIVATPHHRYEEIARWVADFRSAGVKLLWVVSPETKTVLIRRADGTCAEVNETGTLSGENVLPGFTCTVAELFV
jgi:Uma2 family endonuclease